MRSKRTLLAIVVSVGLMVLVAYVADIGAIDLTQIRPGYLPLALIAYAGTLILRACLLRHLTTEATDQRFTSWWSLAARHQFLFTLAPSGAGDLTFPVLANRMVGMPLTQGAALIAGTRLRDICAILGLGCVGLAGLGLAAPVMIMGAILCGLALLFSDLTGRAVARLLRRALSEAPSARWPAACLTAMIWLCASCAIAAGFAAAGHPLSIYQTFIMLAGLNIVGALAISIGGLGIAEAGAAGVLTFLGLPLAEAAAIALIARPILLVTNLAASGLTELVLRATPR